MQKPGLACILFNLAALFAFPCSAPSSALAIPGNDSGREKISINDGWRFQKGDPAGVNTDFLLYDVRPESTNADQKERLAEATEDATKLGKATHPLLKPWILPSGNRFIKDPAKRHARPAGNPGGDLDYVRGDFNDSAWQKVDLPHDWAIAGPFNAPGVGGGMGRLPSPGIGWYRRQLDIPASDAGRRIFLEVEGAMSYATVWLNGHLVGGWPYGYNSWQLDLTPWIVLGGRNQLAIRLDNPPDSSRWYTGGGIYRDVWLVKTAPVHVAQWGARIATPKVSPASATIALDLTIDNDSQTDTTVEVRTDIFPLDSDGRRASAAVASFEPRTVLIAAGASAQTGGSLILENPRLWGPPPTQTPNRYVAVTTLARASDGAPVDRYETRFGIRSVEFTPEGLLVNGERIRIQGVNQHHDLGALGAAFNTRAAERQLELLREAGCNAIRTAHNPPAPALLELTDRMGFLVMDEIFDMWVRQKTPFDTHLIFPDWHEQDLRAMIRRDRNHPSVILWSVGNEVGEQYTGAPGAELAGKLVAIARDEDPARPAAASMNFAKSDSDFAAAVDVIMLNYQGEGIRDTPEFANFKGIRTVPQYPSFHEKFPGKLILSSESAAALSSRGVYLFPVASAISNPVRDGIGGDSATRHVSAYELHAADFGSSADKVFATQDRNPYVAGEFVWTGWDYLGEPTPYYSSRSSYFGMIDLAGFKKDRFHLYQSRWRADLPTAHILPHWTWPERAGQITPVHVFTSGDEAELFLNGKSLGRKKKGAYEYRLRWDDVIYEPGELKVVAYKNGAQWATDSVRTAGPAAKLEASADRSTITADGRDLSFITIRVTDKDGITCPRASDRVEFAIDGPGEIVATDNGDPTDMESFHTPARNAFNGLCLVIVRSKPGQAGTIKVTAASGSLQSASVVVQGVPAVLPAATVADTAKHTMPRSRYIEFTSFAYEGRDPVFDKMPPSDDEYYNPILAGFYPDPSICRAGNDYYIINSTFSYYPGVPIFHSTDLVNWKQIGHILNRPSQLNLDGLAVSQGIFAPAISYHDGIFYMITTNVWGIGNFYVTATNPAGPWSDPVRLPEIDGIDPSFFFDDNGRAYIVHNGPPPDNKPLYDGHRAIWLWDFDLDTKKPANGRIIVNGGVDISQKPAWIEGPHIYKRNGYYYLCAAEGGTSVNHSQVVFRAKSLAEPFVPFPGNPILTQRDLDPARSDPVTCLGHADLVETPNGEWWAVFLGVRPYEDNHYNTGRETFMLPVTWENDWPVILKKGETLPRIVKRPGLPPSVKSSTPPNGSFSWRDDFDDTQLAMRWMFLRNPREQWWTLTAKPGSLLIAPRAIALHSTDRRDPARNLNPSFMACRQQHSDFSVTTTIALDPASASGDAGLACLQNNANYYFLAVRIGKGGKAGEVFLEKRTQQSAEQEIIARMPLQGSAAEIELKMDGNGKYYSFFWRTSPGGHWMPLKTNADGSILSTQSGGGFVGCCIGMYARSNAAAAE